MRIIGTARKKNATGWSYLLAFVILSLVLLTCWAREGEDGVLHDVRSGSKVITTPLSHFGSILGAPFRAVGNAFSNMGTSPSEIAALKYQNDELMAQVMQLEEYRQEAERLQGLLAIRDAYNVQAVGASVIGRSSNSWSFSIEINKGSRDGIEVGMPVMNSAGLIGQVEDVSYMSSTVRLITDENSGVAAMIQSTRAEGILNGSINGTLYLNYITRDQKVQVGDVIITSGMGGVYPKGIAIGEIVSVEGDEGDLYYTIVVAPLTSARYSEEVLVLTGDEIEVSRIDQQAGD